MSKSKSRGTRFETACVRFLRKRLDDERIERRALAGAHDMGDVFGLVAHGHSGIAECKDYSKWGRADLDRWKAETVAERGNADADFALLVVHKTACGERRFGENHCFMQVRDLERVMGGDFRVLAGDTAKEMWVRVTLEDACRMMLGDYGEETV